MEIKLLSGSGLLCIIFHFHCTSQGTLFFLSSQAFAFYLFVNVLLFPICFEMAYQYRKSRDSAFRLSTNTRLLWYCKKYHSYRCIHAPVYLFFNILLCADTELYFYQLTLCFFRINYPAFSDRLLFIPLLQLYDNLHPRC